MNKEPELVDLGLPSGNLWMKYNIGADSETDYGYYYQFGSLIGYKGDEAEKHSTWKTCPFNDGQDEFNEEYFLKNRSEWIYKNGILRPEYDIVTKTYGENFKIPTDIDFQELINNITLEYIKNYKNSKKKGLLLTSKINENTIFLPFSGYIQLGRFLNIENWSYLWSSKLSPGFPTSVRFLSSYSNGTGLGKGFPCISGFTIRGIKVK